MKSNARKQYTIRNIPRSVDQALRRKALRERKSLNTVLLETLAKEAGVGAEPRVYDDLDFLIGSWVADPETETALKEQRKVNPKDWE